MDGVLFDFIGPCIRELRAKFKVDIELEALKYHHHLEDHLLKWMPEAHEYMLEKIVRVPEFYNKLPAIPGAMKVVADLSKDFNIWGITHRPWNVISGTRARMQEFFPAIGDNVIGAKDKVAARNAIGSLIHVEDNAQVIKAMADAGQDVIVLDWPYNRRELEKPHDKIIRVKTLYEAEQVIRTALRRAK